MPSIPPNVQPILEDLYRDDPTLRDRESELVSLIQTLVASRPGSTFDQRARDRLRQELLQVQSRLYPSSSFFSSLFSRMSFSSLKPWAIPFGTIALVGIAVAASTLRSPLSSPSSPTPSAPPSFGTIAHVSARAFGDLGSISGQGGRGGGGGLATISAQRSDGSEKLIASDAMIARPVDMVQYKYVYKGDLPKWDANLSVYKRVKGSMNIPNLIQPLAETTRGLVDLASLQTLGLQSFTAVQNEPYGYSITVDLSEGMVNLNQHYQQWPHPEASCHDEACFQRLRLQPNDVPTDAEAIQIAATFLQEHGISTDSYEAPRVTNEWRQAYETAVDKSMVYIPDVVTVAYPIALEGKTAYEEGGSAHGLMVNVGARTRKVDSVWNLTTNRYESSPYEAETDQARIRAVMEKGGLYGYSSPEADKAVELELDTPELILQHAWLPAEPGRPITELLVPALRFAVKQPPREGYAPNFIFVPLIKDLLNRQEPPMHIMAR